MEKDKLIRACIYSRISDRDNYGLLAFQSDVLLQYAEDNNYLIVDYFNRIDDGTRLNSYALLPLLSAIEDEFIDVVLVYSKDRILCNPDAYTEFKLLCLMHNVSIIAYDEII